MKKQKPKQNKHSTAGKGDSNRVSNQKRYEENWERIFGKKKKSRD